MGDSITYNALLVVALGLGFAGLVLVALIKTRWRTTWGVQAGGRI